MNKKTYIISVCAGLSMCLSVMGNEDTFICEPYPSMEQAQFAYLNIIPITPSLDREELYKKLIPIQSLQKLIDKLGFPKGLSLFSETNLTNAQINYDFAQKTAEEIFKKIFSNRENFLGYVRGEDCTLETETCNISQPDQKVIERVIESNSKDKAILFIGFDQNQPAEGSEIYFNTPGYTRSIFWSKWNNRPDQNHNAIKFCFCKINKLLETNPQLYGFFDYIIIGCQTREYIAPDTWIVLGSMLKSKGRIVYHDYGKRIDEYCGYPAFLNKTLREHCIEGENFNLYKCDDENEQIYQEIKNLIFFNNTPYESSDVCYANARTLYWHKK